MKKKETIIVLMPVYNDWESLSLLLPLLDRAFDGVPYLAHVLIIDDASTAYSTLSDSNRSLRNVKTVEIVRLIRNVGHQRAICIGLCYVKDCYSEHNVIVMDSDGEDDPMDISRLIRASNAGNEDTIVFAERRRRSEGFWFQMFYFFYRKLHHFLVGYRVRFGNFSFVSSEIIKRLVVVSELWNHYAAAVLVSRQPYRSIPCSRAERLAGRSKMSFVNLVIHGLSALAVFSDRIGTRLLVLSMIIMSLIVFAMGTVATIRFATDLAVPGWATYVFGFLIVMLGQLVTFSASICFLILSQRNSFSFLPIKMYRDFIEDIGFVRNHNE